MWVALACLALGVAAMALVGGVRASIQHGIDDQRRALLGGDLAVEGPDPLPDAVRDVLERAGGRVSASVRMRSMLYAARPDGKADRMLVEVQGVDGGWPLVGGVTLGPEGTVSAGLGVGDGLLADPLVADRLHLGVGAEVRLGGWPLRYRAAMEATPDGGGISLAPRVVVALPALRRAGLIRPGMLATWSLRVVLPGGDRERRVRGLEGELARRFPEAGWQVHDSRDAAVQVSHLVTELGQFMALLGLTALSLGGLGVSAGVSSWMAGRRRMMAVLSSLGASSGVIVTMMGGQIALLCGAGVVAGVIVGAGGAAVLARVSGAVLPVVVAPGAIVGSGGLAGVVGVLTAVLFALPAVLRGVSVPPASLFRDDVGVRGARPGVIRGVVVAVGLVLLAVVIGTAQDRRIAVGFVVSVALVFVLFGVIGRGVQGGAGVLARGRVGIVRLGLAVLARRGGAEGALVPRLVLGLGMGLSGLAIVWLVEGGLQTQFRAAMPRTAPSFYFVDIQPSDLERFEAVVGAHSGVRDVRTLPSMRTRVVSVNGVAAERVVASARTRWALKGDHGLTIEPVPVPGTDIVAGRWWGAEYAGAPLLSMDARLAEGWGVKVGDGLVLNVLGRDVAFRVANLRRVQWQSLRMNFAFVASPGMLSHAPHTELATFRTDGVAAHDADILADVTDALPGVTGIRVADVLRVLSGLVDKLALALSALAGVMLVSGILVLVSTVLAARRQRRAEGAILRALGASDRQLWGIWVIEFAVVGVAAGGGAAVCGVALADLVMREVLYVSMPFMPGRVVLVISGALVVMFAVGLVSLRAMVRARPAALLRGR